MPGRPIHSLVRSALRGALLGLLLASALPALAERPRIGLALSGGGARGAAHIGVLRVLEEQRVPIDCIAGTSMGAIVGGLYAAGYDVDDLERVVAEVDWVDTFADSSPREVRSFRRKRDDDLYLVRGKPGIGDDLELKFPSGLIQGQKVDLLFERLTLSVAGVSDFDALRIPYRAVATDIATGEAVVLASGALAGAMRASMSVPGGFAAVRSDGRRLVDGGVSNNLPVDVVRMLCADVVIAVDISTPLLEPDEIDSVFAVTQQLSGFLTRRSTEAQIASLTGRDVLIVPDLAEFTSLDFAESIRTLPAGRAAALAALPQLQALALAPDAYAAYLARHRGPDPARGRPVVEFVRFENDSSLADDVLREYAAHDREALIGRPLDVDLLEKQISRLYGLDLYENITYDVVEEGGRHGVVIKARERGWGPSYLQAGVDWAGDFDGDNLFNFGLLYKRTLLNPLNGELRLAGQLGDEPSLGVDVYQPLDPAQRWFVGAAAGLTSYNSALFVAGEREAEFRVAQRGVSLNAGRNLGDWGEFLVGVERYEGKVDLLVGDPEQFSGGDFDLGLIRASLQADTLDDLRFPKRGYLAGITWLGAREGLGSDVEYDQLAFKATAPFTWGRNTLIPGFTLNTTLDDRGRLESLFRGGGFLRLSGFRTDELAGQHFGLLGAVYYRKINDTDLLPLYLGASLESGNVWFRESDLFDDMLLAGSLFLGADTPLGPLFLAIGSAEGGNRSLYLTLGAPQLISPR